VGAAAAQLAVYTASSLADAVQSFPAHGPGVKAPSIHDGQYVLQVSEWVKLQQGLCFQYIKFPLCPSSTIVAIAHITTRSSGPSIASLDTLQSTRGQFA
jgi:hypothetical protein